MSKGFNVLLFRPARPGMFFVFVFVLSIKYRNRKKGFKTDEIRRT